MKAVYSYWEDFETKTNGGFRSIREMALMLTLSVLESKKQFSSVEFYTTTYGQKIVEDYKIPFDKVHVVLDELTGLIDPEHWAYAKIYVYSLQTEPFIHIDNDVIIWDKLPNHILKSPLFFQNKEHLKEHQGYISLLRTVKMLHPDYQKQGFKVTQIVDSGVKWAYNCGVVGGNDLNTIREWKEIVDQYLFSNKVYWKKVEDKHSHNHLFEQYFISSLIQLKSMRVNTLLGDDFMRSAVRDFRYTHLWGEVKRDPKVIDKVKERLFRDYPQYRENFTQQQTVEEVFTDIYKNELWGQGQGSGGGSSIEITTGYRIFLQEFIDEHEIKSVVDYGCGDWQFSKLINWSSDPDRVYLGIDCVQAVVDKCNTKFGNDKTKFICSNTLEGVEKSDLLIIKDVLIHWPNQEIIKFIKQLNSSKKFKYTLITVQCNQEKLNEDIQFGEFHNLDLNKPPFNFKCKVVYKWDSDTKITYLFKN